MILLSLAFFLSFASSVDVDPLSLSYNLFRFPFACLYWYIRISLVSLWLPLALSWNLDHQQPPFLLIIPQPHTRSELCLVSFSRCTTIPSPSTVVLWISLKPPFFHSLIIDIKFLLCSSCSSSCSIRSTYNPEWNEISYAVHWLFVNSCKAVCLLGWRCNIGQ